LGAQIPRLRILREKKAEDPGTSAFSSVDSVENYFENSLSEIDAPDDISVIVTEATTSGSLFTRYTQQSTGTRGTRATSKNRRREERKRARGKKGTIYEEEYLVNSVIRLMQRVQDIREEVMQLIVALMMIDKRREAEEIQRNFAGLVEDIRSCAVEVSSEPMMSSRMSGDGETPSVTLNFALTEVFKGSQLLV
jgi:elongator complex protein 1